MTTTETTAEQLLCLLCGEPVRQDVEDIEDEDEQWRESVFRDGVVHEECARESISSSSATIVKYNGEWDEPQTSEKVEFDQDSAYSYVDGELYDMADNKGDLPGWFTDHFDGPKWHSTDPWRGFLDVPSHDLVKVTDGWITGFPDDTTQYKAPSWEFSQLLDEQRPPVTVYWVFAPTSNVFSTAIDIYVQAKDGPFDDPKAALLAWIEEQLGHNQATFERAFG